MDTAFPFWTQLTLQAPIFLVWLAGIIVSLVYRHRYPKVAVLTLAAFGLLFLTGLIAQGTMLALPLLQARWQAQFVLFSKIMFAATVLQSLAALVAWILLLIAAFSHRAPEQSK